MSGRLTKAHYPDGHAEGVDYDGTGRVTALKVTPAGSPNETVTTVSYGAPDAPCDSAGDSSSTTVQPPSGSATIYCLNAQGQVTSQHGPMDPNGLDAITDRITAQMSADPNTKLLSVGTNDETNQVDVGTIDVGSDEVQQLKARYGSAINVFADDALEPLEGNNPDPPVAGAGTYRNPVLAGSHIYTKDSSEGHVADCTAGFGYKGSLNAQSDAEGVMTAGHCMDGLARTYNWYQGEQPLGLYASRRNVNGSFADAATIKTYDANGGTRRITNRVFVGVGEPTVEIVRTARVGTGEKGDRACFSGAFGGFHCGALDKVGQHSSSGRTKGNNYNLYGNSHVVIHGVYRLNLDNGKGVLGDSGAPVFRGGTALGIAFARKTRNPDRIYFSQIVNVQAELRVPIYLP